MLQGQTHFVNNTVFYCHTSCNLLNAGTAESYFANITKWLNENENRRNVVTLLIGNSDFRPVTDYVMPLEASGLSELAYKPTKIPMALSDWPTLSDMIILNNRVVIFMDYNANQTEVPYILDEFAQLWETPFSPTNDNFPCTEQRPPGLSQADAEHRMYMANHNLNTEITALGLSLLVPSRAILNHTNGLNGSGSLGAMADDCEGELENSPFPKLPGLWRLQINADEMPCYLQLTGDVLLTSSSSITTTGAAIRVLYSRSPHGIIM